MKAARSNQLPALGITRRRFVGLSAAWLAKAYSLGVNTLGSTEGSAGAMGSAVPALTPLNKAYLFLETMMDLYAKGSALRLAQSYVPTAALNLGATGFTYDNDVTLIAFLERGQSGDLARATVLGNSLVYGQGHDPIGDGRIRNSYYTNPYITSGGSVNINDPGSSVGNVAWTGLALSHLYQQSRNTSHLNAALGLGNWVENNTYDTRGAGGYTGGFDSSLAALTWKSTEYNIDAYAFFTMLASLTGDSAWATRAQHALGFVEAMWNSSGGFFWTGTGTDGVTINTDFIPEDCQSWSYLAFEDAAYASSIDWAESTLAVTDGQFSGVSFSNVDTTGVWFEGTAHMASALEARNGPGDPGKAAAYLNDIQVAQLHAPHTNGRGIDAASKDHLNTGAGFYYFAALHIGATAWYCIARQFGNPFVFLPRRLRRS